MRRIVSLTVALETSLTIAVVAYCLVVGNALDAASADRDAVVFATGLFAFTTAPAAGLLLWGRWLWLAATLAGLPVLALAYRLAGS